MLQVRGKASFSAKKTPPPTPADPGNRETFTMEKLAISKSKKRCSSMSAFTKLCISYGLSCFGDRLWAFGFGLVLMRIGGNIRLIAVNQLIIGILIMFGAASIGRWIDSKPRLTAARTMLTLNNLSVAASALLAAGLLVVDDDIIYLDPAISLLVTCLTILFCAISMLANTGQKIVITKDWVVVISQGNKDLLAERNAMLLRIDLTVMIIAPILAGYLMTSVSMLAGCLLIIGWNLLSWPLEWIMLTAVHAKCPDLKRRKDRSDRQLEEIVPEISPNVVSSPLIPGETPGIATATNLSNDAANCNRMSIASRLLRIISDFFGSFSVYRRQSVFPAAFGLALLYMTVLSFDSITTGFAYSQGLVEVVLAIARGLGAITGISGTLAFPRLRRRFGIVRTGLLALVFELSALMLAVVSIWLPGSPFDPIAYFNEWRHFEAIQKLDTPADNATTTTAILGDSPEANRSLISITVFLVGIILARFGLWLADLSITQTMQENIIEQERGVVFGTQAAINRIFGMLKDAMTIALPDPRTFGLLTIASVAATVSGLVSYGVYAFQVGCSSAAPPPARSTNDYDLEQVKMVDDQPDGLDADEKVQRLNDPSQTLTPQ